MFKISAMDHIVLNVPDIDRSMAFYTQVLGLESERWEEFRQGKVPFPSVRVSPETVIDLFPMKPGQTLVDNYFGGLSPRVGMTDGSVSDSS